MYAGRHRRVISSTRNRRKLIWADTRLGVTVVAIGANFTLDLLAGYRAAGFNANTQGCTIARTIIRGQLYASPLTNPEDAIDVGLIDHTTTGVAAVDPSTDPYEDWAWNDRYPIATGSNAMNSQITAANAWLSQFLIDTKAARKMEELGQTWYLSVSNHSLSTVSLALHARVLLRLP